MHMKKIFFATMIASLMLLPLASCHPDRQGSRHSVTVSGTGTVITQPDLARMNVSFAQTAPTTQEAKAVVERTMREVIAVLQAEGVKDPDMETLALNYSAEYGYRNRSWIRIGQRAEQTLVVTVKDLIGSPERLSSILDKLVGISKVEIQDIRFDIEQKADLFRQSRELAYQKALEKATQYAELCGRKLGKVQSLSERASQDVARISSRMSNVAEESKLFLAEDELAVPTGELGVTSEVEVVFSLD